ncbi:MAG: AbrB/MazE/SpoVT family DNA-binding domain-containing protein [Bacteroidetes bacterium]|nr:AbrB/MazE/SpoVT family DNA-binding domain-containing protein [Bacteroidota bacterium]
MPITVSAKGQVVIPAEIRKALGIKKGDQVDFVKYADAVYLVKVPKDPIQAGYGMFKGGPSLTEALLRDRREDCEREERKIEEWSRRGRAQPKVDESEGREHRRDSE